MLLSEFLLGVKIKVQLSPESPDQSRTRSHKPGFT